MPMAYSLLALLPAPEDLSTVQLAVEIDQTFVEPLEDAANLLQLLEIISDLARHVIDAAAQVELLRRFAPFGFGLSGNELVLTDEIAPLGMQRGDIGDDAADERESLVGFGDSKETGHGNKLLDGQAGQEVAKVLRRTAVLRHQLTASLIEAPLSLRSKPHKILAVSSAIE